MYQPPLLLRFRHFNTMYSTLFRKVNINYQRERIDTPDDDFIDLDWVKEGSDSLVILCHGLEGAGDSPYVKGMAKAFLKQQWDVCAYNYRTCSGEMNRLPKAYHAGATDDLQHVIQHILKTTNYKKLVLVGFSLGGNLILKYLGENPAQVPEKLTAAVAISVPIHLESCAYEIAKPHNFIYNQRFLKKLNTKIRAKRAILETVNLDVEALLQSKSLKDFDDLATAPLHGFDSAVDYWTKNSSKQFLNDIQIPTLLINALDDPFLAEECFPFETPKLNSNFHLLTPKYGGHVGFVQFKSSKEYWSEEQTIQFIKKNG